MSAAVASPPVFFEALSSALGGVWRALLEGEQQPRWLWPTAIDAGDFILDAKDLTDFHERIDICIEERGRVLLPPSDWRGNAKSSVTATATPAERNLGEIADLMEKSTMADRARLAPVLGETGADRWVVGWRGIVGIIRFAEALRASGEIPPSSPSAPSRFSAGFPDGWLRDLLTAKPGGLDVRKAIWECVRGVVVLLPIQRAYEEQRKLPAWVARALTEQFATGVGSFVENVVAAIQAQSRPYAMKDETVAAWSRAADASGEPIYFPLGDAEAH